MSTGDVTEDNLLGKSEGQALIWWTNLLGSPHPPVTVPDIQAAFLAKYRYRKTRSQLKAE